jgi:DNA-binding XRE family transcriptional regulator
MMKIDEKRDLLVTELRASGATQTEIARTLGVTRQRVQQIEHRLSLGARRSKGKPKYHVFICGWCNKTATAKTKGRNFCSRECFHESRRIAHTAEEKEARKQERREMNKRRARDYYNNVFKKLPNWRELVRERNQKYAKKHS